MTSEEYLMFWKKRAISAECRNASKDRKLIFWRTLAVGMTLLCIAITLLSR
jgi:hypothetical protein